MWKSLKSGPMLSIFNPCDVSSKKKDTLEKKGHLEISYMNAQPRVNFVMSAGVQTFLNENGFGVGTNQISKAPSQNHGHAFNRYLSNSM